MPLNPDRVRSTQILDSRSRVLRAALALGALGVAFLVAHSLFHLGGRSLEGFANEGVYTFVELVACAVCVARGLRRRENRASPSRPTRRRPTGCIWRCTRASTRA
jgi:hypothetical protein